MVKARADRPRRRNRGAGPERDGDDDGDAVPVMARDSHPNMTAQREMDRQEVKRARQMGATRRQASMHADDEAGGH